MTLTNITHGLSQKCLTHVMPTPTCINVFVVDTMLVKSTTIKMKPEHKNTEMQILK